MFRIGLGALLIVSFAGCAANLCQRKADAFARCAGSSITYSEPMCESNLDKCNAAEKARIEAYVACLEQMNECSLAATSRCASLHQNAVNLTCTGAT